MSARTRALPPEGELGTP
ncbi:unnamed protein product [Linum tenue]|uniref:Uncharacterized protein n=1 Tax=Linum tenue TaxID=586396 RepID=A0AAV0NS62_9ROSI|nr:unnamed protein product [Linum tenue]